MYAFIFALFDFVFLNMMFNRMLLYLLCDFILIVVNDTQFDTTSEYFWMLSRHAMNRY